MATTNTKIVLIGLLVAGGVGLGFAVPLLFMARSPGSSAPNPDRFAHMELAPVPTASSRHAGDEGLAGGSPSAEGEVGGRARRGDGASAAGEALGGLQGDPRVGVGNIATLGGAPGSMGLGDSSLSGRGGKSAQSVHGGSLEKGRGVGSSGALRVLGADRGVGSSDLAAARDEGGADERRGNTEQYVDHGVRRWVLASRDRLSTFAIDVDTAAYTIARRKLRQGVLPPPASVRVEEFVNYFRYDDPAPEQAPVGVTLESSPSPFADGLTVLRVALRTPFPDQKNRKPVHLTFLVDTSGSMQRPDKIGLVKRSLRYLVDQLGPQDTVAMATYAGNVRRVLDPTGMEERTRIHAAIEGLTAGGSTAMASGLELAYRMADNSFMEGAVNRVIVCSDGDANVGRTSHGDMLSSIKHYAERGITLSTLGFGTGNYKDHRMEQLADKGNGNYSYIDDVKQAKRIFGEQLMGTLQVAAKDVKVQVEFDPNAVKRYRLVGYENRHVADRDFRNDKVDAGEIGLGHAVTALYEVEVTRPQSAWATVRVRYKAPDGVKARERAFPIAPHMHRAGLMKTSRNFRRALAAACLAENLRQSPFVDSWTMGKAEWLARKALDRESEEELELIELIERAASLMRGSGRSVARL